jgi:hypothetical protein
LSLWQRRWRWQQLHYLQKRETHLRILRIAWNFFLASSNAASGSSIRHISVAAMDFPYLACHPHQSQKVAVVRQSNKRHELPAQSKERVTVFFFLMCKITPTTWWLRFIFSVFGKKKVVLGVFYNHISKKKIRTIARFLYHVQVGSQWYRRMRRFFYFHNSFIAKFC